MEKVITGRTVKAVTMQRATTADRVREDMTIKATTAVQAKAAMIAKDIIVVLVKVAMMAMGITSPVAGAVILLPEAVVEQSSNLWRAQHEGFA